MCIRDSLDTFEAFELLAREKGYHLSIQLPEEKTTPVFCDSDRIRQVLSVLLHTAFSFCPSGSRITLSLSQQDKITSISVADKGPGIPDDRKAHLFDRFYRGDSSRQDTCLLYTSFIFLSFIPYIPPDFASGQGTHEDLVSVAVSMPGRGEGGLDI